MVVASHGIVEAVAATDLDQLPAITPGRVGDSDNNGGRP